MEKIFVIFVVRLMLNKYSKPFLEGYKEADPVGVGANSDHCDW